jgi:hypothetical protein
MWRKLFLAISMTLTIAVGAVALPSAGGAATKVLRIKAGTTWVMTVSPLLGGGCTVLSFAKHHVMTSDEAGANGTWKRGPKGAVTLQFTQPDTQFVGQLSRATDEYVGLTEGLPAHLDPGSGTCTT